MPCLGVSSDDAQYKYLALCTIPYPTLVEPTLYNVEQLFFLFLFRPYIRIYSYNILHCFVVDRSEQSALPLPTTALLAFGLGKTLGSAIPSARGLTCVSPVHATATFFSRPKLRTIPLPNEIRTDSAAVCRVLTLFVSTCLFGMNGTLGGLGNRCKCIHKRISRTSKLIWNDHSSATVSGDTK